MEVKEGSRRGRKPGKKSAERMDVRAKLGKCVQCYIMQMQGIDVPTARPEDTFIVYYFLVCPWTMTYSFFVTERSRQSARECRARKKLRYQYLEELVTDREKAVFALRQELEKVNMSIFSMIERKMKKSGKYCLLFGAY